jgi:hypothetical protein
VRHAHHNPATITTTLDDEQHKQNDTKKKNCGGQSLDENQAERKIAVHYTCRDLAGNQARSSYRSPHWSFFLSETSHRYFVSSGHWVDITSMNMGSTVAKVSVISKGVGYKSKQGESCTFGVWKPAPDLADPAAIPLQPCPLCIFFILSPSPSITSLVSAARSYRSNPFLSLQLSLSLNMHVVLCHASRARHRLVYYRYIKRLCVDMVVYGATLFRT